MVDGADLNLISLNTMEVEIIQEIDLPVKNLITTLTSSQSH